MGLLTVLLVLAALCVIGLTSKNKPKQDGFSREIDSLRIRGINGRKLNDAYIECLNKGTVDYEYQVNYSTYSYGVTRVDGVYNSVALYDDDRSIDDFIDWMHARGKYHNEEVQNMKSNHEARMRRCTLRQTHWSKWC